MTDQQIPKTTHTDGSPVAPGHREIGAPQEDGAEAIERLEREIGELRSRLGVLERRVSPMIISNMKLR
jgi:hypothetical protein